MSLTNSPISGIVTVMGDAHHQERAEGMGRALQRLSAARELRGSAGIVEYVDEFAHDRDLDASAPASRRIGRFFRFADRARRAGES